MPEPVTITKASHGISQKAINSHAIDIIKKLTQHGFESYIVGGGVRDLLLKQHPKDFDIVTSALPSQIKKIFHNCRIIGRRFRLAHVYSNSGTIEVATFRAAHDEAGEKQHIHHQGIIMRDNIYGSLEQDAARRDFTINALYYDVKTETLKDFFDGFQDLKQGVIRVIGEPEKRYREDPIRILRAIRFAGKLDFKLEERSERGISKLISLLAYVPAARLYDEILKLFYQGCAEEIFLRLNQYHLFEKLFPIVKTCIPEGQRQKAEKLLQLAFHNTDKRIKKNQSINQAFLFAVLLWVPTLVFWNQYRDKNGLSNMEAFHQAAREVMLEQHKHIAIPRRNYLMMEAIWRLQYYLEAKKARQIYKIFNHHRFRAAYDLLMLRAGANDSLRAHAHFWTQFQNADEAQRNSMIEGLGK